MSNVLRLCRGTAIGLATLVLIAAGSRVALADDDYSKVSGSVHVAAGKRIDDATTVNGSVEIGSNATVKQVRTVNGSATLREHSSAESVKTVNGSAHLEEGVRVSGNVGTVNGRVTLAKRVEVTGHVSNVNGDIELDGARVDGDIETVTGDIDIGANSRVEGGILVRKSGGWGWGWFNSDEPRVIRVVIGPGATVKGSLKFEREVKLYVSDSASIGPVEGATVNKFSGARP